MSKITIKDIALALNYSTSTISRALRDSFEISPKTKKIIQEYALKNHFRPNSFAQGLKGKKSKVIGVIVPEIENDFFSGVIDGIEDLASKNGFVVTIFQTKESPIREYECLQNIYFRQLDGAIISISGDSELNINFYQQLINENFPIVFVDRVPLNLEANKVISENIQGAFSGTEHLIKTGKKRIGLISAPKNLSISIERIKGYKLALEKHKIPFDENLICYCNLNSKETLNKIKNLITVHHIDALLAASDRLVLNCYAALKELNINIPNEIGVVGFTNLKIANYLNPSLTTITQSSFEMGKSSFELLLSSIQQLSKNSILKPKIKIVETKFNLRESSLNTNK